MKPQLFLFLFAAGLLRAQVNVVNQSEFKHDYVLAGLSYVEDQADTSRLHYIATIRYDKTKNGKKLKIGDFYDDLQIEARKLDADFFYFYKEERTETTASFWIKMYFGGESFRKRNELKQKKDSVYVFDSPTPGKGFFWNGQLKVFKGGLPYIGFPLNQGDVCSISLNKNPNYYSLQKGGKARFFCLLNDVYYYYPGLGPGQKGSIAYGRYARNIKPKEKSCIEMDYVIGRFLMALCASYLNQPEYIK